MPPLSPLSFPQIASFAAGPYYPAFMYHASGDPYRILAINNTLPHIAAATPDDFGAGLGRNTSAFQDKFMIDAGAGVIEQFSNAGASLGNVTLADPAGVTAIAQRSIAISEHNANQIVVSFVGNTAGQPFPHYASTRIYDKSFNIINTVTGMQAEPSATENGNISNWPTRGRDTLFLGRISPFDQTSLGMYKLNLLTGVNSFFNNVLILPSALNQTFVAANDSYLYIATIDNPLTNSNIVLRKYTHDLQPFQQVTFNNVNGPIQLIRGFVASNNYLVMGLNGGRTLVFEPQTLKLTGLFTLAANQTQYAAITRG